MIIELQPRPILFFDGVCTLCNKAFQFVLKHDKKKRFLFATLQSAAGREAMKQINMPSLDKGTFILFFMGKYYTKSSAALLTLKLLGGLWQLLFALTIVPSFLRNMVYDLVARNRYRWFGRKDQCMLPNPEISDRFIEE